MHKIVVDIYGADAGPEVIIRGVAAGLKQGICFFPVLVGDAELIRKTMDEAQISQDRYEILDTDKYITNNDPPTCVFGGMDDSSMVMAYSRLKQDDGCHALLSAGNTGALLVGSIFRLGLQPGLKFPALASALPAANGKLVCLVDCGANVECSAADLVRFARMGNVFSRAYCGIENPRVGLMNVGREAQKGTALTKEAYEKLQTLPLNFIGNLEGSDLLTGYADVVVTDGFSGNLLLKNAEAVGKAALAIVEQVAADADPGLLAKIRESLTKAFDFNAQGAATFLGTKKTVVKMHGCADENTVVTSVLQILRLEKAGFAQAMQEEMAAR